MRIVWGWWFWDSPQDSYTEPLSHTADTIFPPSWWVWSYIGRYVICHHTGVALTWPVLPSYFLKTTCFSILCGWVPASSYCCLHICNPVSHLKIKIFHLCDCYNLLMGLRPPTFHQNECRGEWVQQKQGSQRQSFWRRGPNRRHQNHLGAGWTFRSLHLTKSES